eukprot:m.34019 g.34019  ORF g.34019 m.34019 type:complete len:54 (+) comp9717_c0_seq1:90-251(+)
MENNRDTLQIEQGHASHRLPGECAFNKQTLSGCCGVMCTTCAYFSEVQQCVLG